MIAEADRDRFGSLAGAGSADAHELAAALKAGSDAAPLQALAALWTHAAVAAPERIPQVYDAFAEAWLGEPVQASPVALAPQPAEPISRAFWDAFWRLAERPLGELDALGVTVETGALLGHVSPELRLRAGRAALAYPGCAEAVAQGWPERFRLEDLAACPRNSVAGDFHALIVENGFDLEVLDRDALGLKDAEPPLDYLNARILQCHDLWHLVGGYRTTGLHEVAISAFQLGQFGHHYSAMFLAAILARLAFAGAGAPVILDVVARAWRHGRESPPLLPVDWPSVWALPVEEVRRRLGIAAFQSPWPADLFEQLAA